MAEEVKELNQETGDNSTTEKDKSATAGEVQSQNTITLDEARKMAQSERDKTAQKMQKQLDELNERLKRSEREKLTEEERRKAETEEANKELEEIRKQSKTERQQMIVARELYNAGLPEDFAKRINGGDDDEIKADVLALKAYLDKQAQTIAEVELKKRLGGVEPKGGNAPAGKTMSEGEFLKLTAKEQSKFMADGGTIGD